MGRYFLFLFLILPVSAEAQKRVSLSVADSNRVKADLTAIIKTPESRNYRNIATLDQVADQQIPIIGMVCLEMIGYFDTSPRSQQYPVDALKTLFGDESDFISVIHRTHNGRFGSRFARRMKKQKRIETHSLKGTANIQGVDFSDHRSYRAFGYPAVMVTNTAFSGIQTTTKNPTPWKPWTFTACAS